MLSYTTRPSSMARTIEAKLSSVRIMSALSFATSVPVIPIAMPRSALLSAGASFTPSPVMATIWPFFLNASTIFSLCSGSTRAYTRTLSTSLSKSRGSMAASPAPDAGAPARLNRLHGVLARGVHHPDEAEEHEAALHGLLGEDGKARLQLLVREREHAKPAERHVLVLRDEVVTLGRGKRPNRLADPDAGTPREHALRGPFREGDEPRESHDERRAVLLRKASAPPDLLRMKGRVDRRHHPPLGGEGNLGHPRERALQILTSEAAAHREREERGFGGIPLRLPGFPLLPELGVVAKGAAREQLLKDGARGDVDGLTREDDAAFRGDPRAVDVEGRPAREDGADVHLP